MWTFLAGHGMRRVRLEFVSGAVHAAVHSASTIATSIAVQQVEQMQP